MTAITRSRETKKFLFKLREHDSEFGVSESIFNRLMSELSLNQTELVPEALRDLAGKTIPAYEPDDGPLTDGQIATIRKRPSDPDWFSVAPLIFKNTSPT
ncbi:MULTISPECIES: hypothetical protein [Photorhabdus]|uniref:Uncharacterized protein n=2 Tax=Photorhabdus TaxID=29487 RepID=A0AAW6BPP6_9GAMM|nr:MULTISPECIES: hypothetical protein [Photorhabdus]EYU13352.1 hypothetical protein BA1DRAFT_04177 [Photorhabdus aegyptia]MDB6374571.1 hypothetical protein [Photorhabdus bodei]